MSSVGTFGNLGVSSKVKEQNARPTFISGVFRSIPKSVRTILPVSEQVATPQLAKELPALTLSMKEFMILAQGVDATCKIFDDDAMLAIPFEEDHFCGRTGLGSISQPQTVHFGEQAWCQ